MADTAPRNMPWSLKGVTHEARAAAKTSARVAGVPLGQWLSGAIRASGSRAPVANDGDGGGTDAGRDGLS